MLECLSSETQIVLEAPPGGANLPITVGICLVRSLEFVLSLVPNPISWAELSAVAADSGGVSSLLPFLNTGNTGELERNLRKSDHGWVWWWW